MDSDEEREKYEALGVKLTPPLRSIKSDGEGIVKVIGFDKILLQLIIQNIPKVGLSSPGCPRTEHTEICCSRPSRQTKWDGLDR